MGKSAQNLYSVMQIMTAETTTLWTLYVHVVLNSVIFHKFYMILFYMLDALYQSSSYPSITLINYVLSYRKVTWTNE